MAQPSNPVRPAATSRSRRRQRRFRWSPPEREDDEKTTQHQDDRQVAWSRDMSSAELAYILFQAPVLVAVHASEMLPK